jgi:hypothetical protein
MKFLLMLIFTLDAYASLEVEEARESIKALIRPLIAGSSKQRPTGIEKFRVDKCEDHKINWMNVLLKKEEAKIKFTWKPGCDIQGEVRPEILSPFPLVLELRHLQNYNHVKTTNKVTANLETSPILNLEMREGLLSGTKSRIKFEAHYSVRIAPHLGKAVSENLGGELRISEINGKKVSIKEKILVK